MRIWPKFIMQIHKQNKTQKFKERENALKIVLADEKKKKKCTIKRAL